MSSKKLRNRYPLKFGGGGIVRANTGSTASSSSSSGSPTSSPNASPAAMRHIQARFEELRFLDTYEDEAESRDDSVYGVGGGGGAARYYSRQSSSMGDEDDDDDGCGGVDDGFGRKEVHGSGADEWGYFVDFSDPLASSERTFLNGFFAQHQQRRGGAGVSPLAPVHEDVL